MFSFKSLGARNVVKGNENGCGWNECSLTYNAVSPLSLLKNPMILIGVLGFAFVIGMPYLLDNSTPRFFEISSPTSSSYFFHTSSFTNHYQRAKLIAYSLSISGP